MKRVFWILLFIFLIFTFGIVAENKIRENFNFKKVEKVDPPTLVNYGEAKERVVVKRVIDGDTIELEDKRKVRYIGVNAPEMNDKRASVLCFANMARAENQRLVEGKVVEMEKDISDKDKYDRLLRYVWINGEMVNLNLIKNGFAKIATYPPDVKYKEIFLEASKSAKSLICSKI